MTHHTILIFLSFVFFFSTCQAFLKSGLAKKQKKSLITAGEHSSSNYWWALGLTLNLSVHGAVFTLPTHGHAHCSELVGRVGELVGQFLSKYIISNVLPGT